MKITVNEEKNVNAQVSLSFGRTVYAIIETEASECGF